MVAQIGHVTGSSDGYPPDVFFDVTREKAINLDVMEVLNWAFRDALTTGDEHPTFVSDVATLDDVLMVDDRRDFIRRCGERYGVAITDRDLERPLWQLVDHLTSRKQQIAISRRARKLLAPRSSGRYRQRAER